MRFVLHSIAITTESAIGIWLFAKVFPRRKEIGKKQILAEWMLYTIFMVIVYFKSANSKSKLIILGMYLLTLMLYCLYCWYIKTHKNLDHYRKWIQCGIGIGLSIVCVIILISNFWESYISTLAILMGNMGMQLILYIFFECDFWQAYLWEVLYQSIVSFLKNFYLIYFATKLHAYMYQLFLTSEMPTYESILFEAIIYLIMIVFAFFFPMEKLLKKIMCGKRRYLLLSVSGMFGILSVFMILGQDGFDMTDITLILISTIVLMFSFMFLFSYAFMRLGEADRKLIEVRNRAIEQQYIELNRAYEQKRSLLHDEKHRIQYLGECLKNGEIQEAEKFISEYQSELFGYAGKSWTGIPTIDLILNVKKRSMDMREIRFLFDADIDSIPIKDSDFVVLLGNLFDNAIEAAQKCEKEKRRIQLSIRTVNTMFLLEMENSCQDRPVTQGERFLTSKQDKENHGIGIESIRHIVQRNEGIVNFEYKESVFHVVVILNNNDISRE